MKNTRSILALFCVLAMVPGVADRAGAVPASAIADTTHAPPHFEPVRARWGAAIGEMTAVNAVVWSFNEYVRGAEFAQLSPRTWRANIDEGFTWDDNNFLTNQFGHPYQGSMYYGAARNNGLDFWQSSPIAFLGSLQWECCGETHPMSVNDWINTGMGGIALGEMGYRAAHVLWNSRSLPGPVRHGVAALANPIGALHRWFGDEHPSVRDNPSPDALLWASTRVGYRFGTAESVLDRSDPASGTYFEIDLLYGDPGRVRRPYDSFRLTLQLNTADTKNLERVQIEGILKSWSLHRDDTHFTSLQLLQGFDYVNTDVMEVGGQSIGLEVREWRRFGGGWNGLLRGTVRGLVLAAIDSEFAFLADVADPERLREYDFGPGYGATAVAGLLRGNQLVVGATWGGYAIATTNGSVYEGKNTDHSLQYVIGRAQWPLSERLAIGGEYVRYSRTTRFDFLESLIEDPSTTATTELVKFFVQIR